VTRDGTAAVALVKGLGRSRSGGISFNIRGHARTQELPEIGAAIRKRSGNHPGRFLHDLPA
jgi:hypothetical protein